MSTSTITLSTGAEVTLVPLPTSPAPRMVEPWVADTVASITFPFTGQTQTQGSSGADLWGMNVTYPPLTASEAAPILAWLRQLRGISRGFQWTPAGYTGPQGSCSGTPSAGVAGANLAPDSSLLNDWADWTFPGNGWSIVTGPTAGGGTNAIEMLSGSYAASVSNAIPVVPGQEYTFSCYVSGPAYTAAASGPVAIEIQYSGGYVYVNPPAAGGAEKLSQTFTVPAGITSVQFWVSPQGSTWSSGTFLVSSFQLCVGSSTPAYSVSATSTTQSAASTTLLSCGWTPSANGVLMPGDYIQIGHRLYTVCDTVDADASGNASFEIWPSLREPVITGQQIITTNPQGLFRLAQNKRKWSLDYTHMTALSFPIVEYR